MATVGKWSGREARALREALRMSVRGFATHLGVNERTITKWEAGSIAIRPRPELQAALDTVLGNADDKAVARFEVALQSAPSPTDAQTDPTGGENKFFDLRAAVSTAAAESTNFLLWAEMENVGELTLEQLQSEVRRVVRTYSHEPAESLFMRTRALRDRAFVLLEGKHCPGHARDLYTVAGWSLTFLAWMSLDFGRPDAAKDHVRAAWLCAERAEYDGLRAWVRAMQTTAAFWQDDFGRAAQYAADGLRYAQGSAALLLASAHATNLAHAGRDEMAWEALRQAQQFAETVDQASDELGGFFSCDLDRASGFWSETQLTLGQPAFALEQAIRGIAAFEAQLPEQRNLSSERFVRLQQVRAHLALGQLDDAERALAPVLETPSEHRVHPLLLRMNAVQTATVKYLHESIARRIRAAALDFQRDTIRAPPE